METHVTACEMGIQWGSAVWHRELSPVLKAFCFKTLDAQGIIGIALNTLKSVIWNSRLSLYINQELLHLCYGYNQPPNLSGQTPKKPKHPLISHSCFVSVDGILFKLTYRSQGWWSFHLVYAFVVTKVGWRAYKTLCCLLKRSEVTYVTFTNILLTVKS